MHCVSIKFYIIVKLKLAFLLVHPNDLLEDRHIDDVNTTNISLLFLLNGKEF